MTGTQTFFSFANHVKTALDGSGITIYIEKSDTSKNTPYLVLQCMTEHIRNGWVSNQLCQGWVIVEANQSIEPLGVTAGRVMDRILAVTRDVGMLEKYDYSQTPTKLVGSYIPKIMEITPDMSSDPLRSKRVVTWELISNASL